MQITTKFSIGDKVWLIHEGWPVCVQVREVRVNVEEEMVYDDAGKGGDVVPVARVTYLAGAQEYPEAELMASREELVEWFSDAAKAADEEEDEDAGEGEEG